jgi:uncharacterized protein YbjT (DUF2867 family)
VATVLIIGASRGIGLETVKAALKAGHLVRALARSARRISVDHPKLEKIAGDALEMATVKRALTGVDAVIQSLGGADVHQQIAFADTAGIAAIFPNPKMIRRRPIQQQRCSLCAGL